MKLGIRISLEEIRADEFQSMLLIIDERDKLDTERLPGQKIR